MKNDRLDTVGYVDSQLIEKADKYTCAKKKNTWTKWASMAACLCLVAVGAFVLNTLFKNRDAVIDDSAAKNEIISDNSSISEPQKPAIDDIGLYIPTVELPETTDGAVYDMIGLVVYNGGIYTQSENYYDSDALKIDSLIGEYLGYATGSINEWSTQDEYAKEFASTVEGEVYEVLGYDTDFRICVRKEMEDENGEKLLFIEFLERLNGITLTTGEDLFETRLHICDRIANIQWQSHNDWNSNEGNIQNAAIDADLWNEFFNQLCKGYFVNTWNDECTDSSIYDTPKQAHIFLTLKDGTVTRLRLIDGGYVGYDGLGWYFVQVPEETFDAIFTACGGNVQ